MQILQRKDSTTLNIVLQKESLTKINKLLKSISNKFHEQNSPQKPISDFENSNSNHPLYPDGNKPGLYFKAIKPICYKLDGIDQQSTICIKGQTCVKFFW